MNRGLCCGHFLWALLGGAVEHDEAGRVGSRDRDIGSAVTVEIPNSHAIDRTLAVTEAPRREALSRAVVEIDDSGSFDVTDYGFCATVAISICCNHRIWRRVRPLELDARRKIAFAIVHVNKTTKLFVARGDARVTAASEIANRDGASGRRGRSPFRFACEVTLSIVEVVEALAVVAARKDHVGKTVAVDVRDGDGCGARCIGQVVAVKLQTETACGGA